MVRWYGNMPLGSEKSVEAGDLWQEEPEGKWFRFDGKDWREYGQV